MEVVQVLHMNGGIGETSYANNSLLQKKVLSLTKPITEEAIVSHFSNRLTNKALVMADLGCSSGPNTLLLVTELVNAVHSLCRKIGRRLPEIQVYLNDLPGNDFNAIFKSLPRVQGELRAQVGPGLGHCFIAGVPGSFYGRLFPSQTLDFVHSSYSLQWLSQVPEGVENNKGNICMATTSPSNVIKAYKEQFQKDFSFFLRCRSEEVVSGGQMVLTFLGRRSEDPSSKEGCYIWELMAMALNDMVKEGLIDEEKMDTFNIPQYTPSPSEVKYEVMKEGSFKLNRLEVSQVNWDLYKAEFSELEALNDGGYSVANCMRAVAEPLLMSHFGEGIIDEVFCRYQDIISDRMSRERIEFINVTISVSKI